ncbi:COPII coat assembly protein sec16, partial [Lachnellula suecica]
MSSDSASASWHPAHMPNSSADTIHTESTPEPSSSTALAAEAILEHPNPETSFPSSELNTEESAEEVVHAEPDSETAQDNTGHPELSTLRDALETSLASPGGVEMDESPFHNGASNPEAVEEDKADFPSEGPSNESKHLSTMSFARTVSGEVNWAEDDEADSEWNLQRSDTDPFKMMAKSDRTNTFPEVPPAHAPGIAQDEEHLPQSQAKEIMKEVEQEPRELFGDDENDGQADFFAQQIDSKDGPFAEPHDATIGAQDPSDFGRAYGGDFQQEEDQARYEEGLPLVQSEEAAAANPPSTAFMDDAGEDEEDFFAQVSKSEQDDQPPQIPPPLERKSTFQVMDSLQFQPHEQTHPAIAEENMESSQSSLDRAVGGGIAVSTSTVLSQVLGDPDAPIHSQEENLAGLEMDSGEGDLAAKWKAALAGDEFLDDDELLEDDEPADNGAAIDPAALFGSDDEGFLDDNDDQDPTPNAFSPPVPAPVTGSNGHVVGFDSLSGAARPRPTSSSSNRYLPTGATTAAAPPVNNYAPTGPMLTDLSRPATLTPVPSSFFHPNTAPSFPPQQQPQRPELLKAQSFANQSKGGYSSPYDLPMDVVKPRKRPSMQHLARTSTQNMPPPRSSSMFAQPPPPSRGSTSSLSPPTSSHSTQQGQLQPPGVPPPNKIVKKSASGFFEELPMSSRPRPAPRQSTGYGSPALGGQTPPVNGPPATAPHSYASTAHQIPPPMHQPPPQGLVAPEKISPYASLPTPAAAPPAIASRYSPAPSLQHSQTAPPPVSRYSPAPPAQRQPSQPYTSSVPRTSSPLAHFERSQEPRHGSDPSFDRRSSSSAYDTNQRANHLPPTHEVDENEQSPVSQSQRYGSISQQDLSQPPQNMRAVSTPPPQSLSANMTSPPKRTPSSYLPQQHNPPQAFVPPQRSQTQSPGSAFAGPRLEMTTPAPYQRPASVEVPTSPRNNVGPVSVPMVSSQGRPRGFSQGLNYIAPTDGREHDPMQRWKGAPVFAWGVGGTIITSFPKDVPRYGMNQLVPMILRSPGEVKTRNIKDLDPLQQRFTSFPGPLKGKSKKKDVVTWLGSGIDELEQNASYLRTVSNLTHDDKRTEERILLWKILRVFVENDGTLEGNSVVEKAVRAVLSPGLDDENVAQAPLYATGADLSGISHSSNSGTRADPVDPAAVDQLRKHLLRGEREKAVWEAVDKRLWAHAMLISNTVSKELYKQVAQEFVQKEVKNIGENTESLAALYEIFAGNFEESIDELVAPSARAGFQMVSTTNVTGPSKDALDGLDRWRETLGLVLSNRSVDDIQALNALGKMLSGYGRAEAAHICFLFARNVSVFGGIDDPSVSMVLVGSDHLRQPYEFDKEMEPILLSEVFEYGLSLSNTSKIPTSIPHLAIYKLQHATNLAEYGHRDKALQYCDSIAASITSQTRRSPYHHALLISALEDLSKRLKQSPKDETSSWIAKPSIDKVSGSLGSLFNKFVAGGDEDNQAPGSTTGSGTESGPFARIAGGTPTISRSPSQSDIYGSYNGGLGINGAATSSTKASSRYAPNRTYTPEPHTASSYGSQPRTSLEGRSSGEHGRYEPQRQMSNMSDYQPSSQSTGNSYTPQMNTGYMPQSSYTPSGAAGSPYTPQLSTPITEQPPSNIYEPPASSGYEPPSSSGYEPPSSGYAPPSYEPATMNDEPDSPVDTKAKKKSFMADDDDDIPALKRAPESREKTKAEKDREADAAFRAAAEADAQKAAPAKEKKSWGFGGWWGGSKEQDMSSAAPSNKPIRAKLGESSSFYYDPDLKRWINKKGGDTAPTPTATPPPPRAAGPPRTASGPPPSAPGPAIPRSVPIARAASEMNLGGG